MVLKNNGNSTYNLAVFLGVLSSMHYLYGEKSLCMYKFDGKKLINTPSFPLCFPMFLLIMNVPRYLCIF